MATNPPNILEEILGDGATQQVLQELGVAESAKEVQLQILGMVGSNIMKRLALEILTVIPKSDHAEFERLVGSGEMQAMRDFLEPRIAGLDEFMLHYANMEYEATKTEIHRLDQETPR